MKDVEISVKFTKHFDDVFFVLRRRNLEPNIEQNLKQNIGQKASLKMGCLEVFHPVHSFRVGILKLWFYALAHDIKFIIT